MGALPYFYADHFVYLSIKALPKAGACLDVFFHFGGITPLAMRVWGTFLLMIHQEQMGFCFLREMVI